MSGVRSSLGFDTWDSEDEPEVENNPIRIIVLATILGTAFWLVWSQYDRASLDQGSATPSADTRPVRVSGSSALSNANALPVIAESIPSSIFDPAKHPDWRLKTLNIEDVRVGMRVPALNPQGIQKQPDASARDSYPEGPVAHRGAEAQSETAFGTPDPKTWRTFRFQVEKEDRKGDLEVTLLRPAEWLVEQQQSTVLLAMLAQWQLAEEESSAPIGFSSAVRTFESLVQFDPLSELIETMSLATEFATPIQYFHSTDPLRGLVGFSFAKIESEIVEQAEADLAWIAAIDSVLSGEATGSQIWLEMPELGAVGLATVSAIEPCPETKTGPGRIVTATFKHASADVLDLRFASTGNSAVLNSSSSLQSLPSSLTLGVTAAHPFWSVDREDFVPAGELLPQEQVIGIDGQYFRLTSITPRAGPETVYNFEVALDHVYYVGEGGVLVHNLYLTKDLQGIVSRIDRLAKARATMPIALLRKAAKSISKGKQIAVIGEDMARVGVEVSRLRKLGFNAKGYQAWSKNFVGLTSGTPEFTKALSRNALWISGKAKAGYQIVDIGRIGNNSAFYALETQILRHLGVNVF